MKIFDKNNIEIHDIEVDDSSVRYRSIMNDDSLTLNFSLTGPINVPQFSYVNFESARYTLWRPQEFKKHSTRNHEYTLTLHGYREFLKFVKYKDMSTKPYRLKFSLTAKPIVFLQNLVACLNANDPAGGWVVGNCIDAPEKTLSFNHEYCIDVFGRIAQEWETEYEFENKTVHLRKVEKFKAAPLPLSYGKGNGFLPGVGRYNDGDKQPVGRLYVQGGERNIDFSTYNSKSLLLPKSVTLVVDGKTYRTDADGMYITRDGGTNTAEDSYDASEIYPKRVGTVSEVVVVDAAKNFYDIKDSSIPETLNYRNCRIAGEKAIIKFESGALAGREFDIEQTETDLTGYIHAERRFKIVPQELDGHIMPGGVFVPAIGDKYAIFNISMPASYISDNATKTGASWDMFREAVRYFSENENDRFRFTGELDGVWSKSKWLEIGGKITPGGHVLFSDEQFQPAGVVIRILAVKDYVNNPHKPEITLSNAPVSGSFSSGLAKLEADEVKIEETKKEVLRFSKRQWRDARETMEMLNASLLNYSGAINPITVQTMQLILGDESLQFRFVNSKTIPVRVNHPITFNAVNKTLSAAAGILQHMTIGITTLKNKHAASEYKYWDMAAYTSPALDASKAYYLYAKCSKTTTPGTFLLSETAIAMEGVAGFYHFLVGILNSENLGERSFASLYGYTEITPGRVVTNRIESEDGGTFFDLVNGIIGGKIRFIATGGTETNLADWADGAAQDIQAAQGAANAAALAAQQAIDDAAANVGLINTEVGKLQAQIDGEVSNWFYPYSPTLANYPASDWTTNAIKDRHVGDTFTNTAQAPATDAGKSWRFVKNGTVYSWTQIADSDAVLALQKAAQAQSTADGKSTTYLIQPSSYKFGDMWVLAADTTVNGIAYKSGEILTATQDSTTYNQTHWVKKVRYTDDTAVNNLQIGGVNLIDGTSDQWVTVTTTSAQYYIDNFFANTVLEVGQSYVFAWEAELLSGTAAGKVTIGVGTSGYQADIYDNGTPIIGKNRMIFTPNTVHLATHKSFAFRWYNNRNAFQFRFRKLKLEKGNKQTDWSLSENDVNTSIADAKLAGTNAQAAANAANTAVGNLNTYVEGSFKDGVIEASEAKAIEKYINIVNTDKSNLEATYNTLYTNTYLDGTPKTNLLNAKVTYFGAVDTLLGSINTAITDGKTTIAEKQAVDANYASYKTAIASLQTAIENANKAIQAKLDTLSTEKVNNLQIGGINNFKSTTPIAAWSTTPDVVYYNNNIVKKPTGFNFTGIQGKKCLVRVNGISGNGWWTVSFDLTSNVANSGFNVTICNQGAKAFLTNETANTPKRFEISVLVSNYTESVYNFIDFYNIDWIYFNVSNLKIEEGNKATAYSESPEDVQARIDKAKLTAEQAQLAAEGYIAARYVRDFAKGSTSNNNNIWGEIKVINKAGTNIAIGKIPSANGTFETANPASNATDNNTTTYATIPNVSNVANYVQIDLGAINYDIDYIQVWHYPERTFYGTKTEISTDGVNWTPVFDSAKSGTYKETAAGNIISLRPHEVLAKTLKSQAITDKFGTTIDGGLIGAVTMLLRELNSTDETAGISGIRGANRNLPAFWTGTYADAIAGTAGIIFRHNSTGKIGVLDVDANGNVKLLDAADPNLIRLIFSKSQIPLVADILSSTQFGQSVTNLSSTGSTTGSTTLANGLSVTKDGSELTFSGILSVYAILDFAHGYTSGYAEISISLFKNGFYYAALSSVGGSLDASMDIINETYNLNSKLIVPSGNYTIVVQRTFYGVRNQTGGISNTSTFAWSFVKDIRRFEFGLDGYMSWYTNCHSHFTENGGYDGRAPYNKWNMPGVLAAGSVTSGGGQSNVWGAKSNPTAGATPISGGFRVPLNNMGHNQYVAQITPHTNTTFRVGTKTATYFEIFGTGGFDYVVIGNNYNFPI